MVRSDILNGRYPIPQVSDGSAVITVKELTPYAFKLAFQWLPSCPFRWTLRLITRPAMQYLSFCVNWLLPRLPIMRFVESICRRASVVVDTILSTTAAHPRV